MNINWNTAQDFEYFDTVSVSATTSVVTTDILVSSTRTVPATNFQSGKVSNPLLLKAVRFVLHVAATSSGLTTANINDIVTILTQGMLRINRGNQRIFEANLSRFCDSIPIIGEKGTAASQYGLFYGIRPVVYNSDLVLMPADQISAQLVYPAIANATTVISMVAIAGKLAV
jgi:hypothetical protein